MLQSSKSQYEKYIEIAYITLLGVVLGSILTLGIFVAPSIFGSENILASEEINNFQEGLIMTSIFLKFNYLLNFTVIITLLFEGYKYKNGERGDLLLISTIFVIVSTSLLFTNYYTPQILELQSLEETESEVFKNLHFASELDFKILAFALLLLIVKRLKSLQR